MKRLLLFSGILFIIKLYLIIFLELGVDEAYYYTYAKKLQWSYFDHPFMIAILERISTLGLTYSEEWNLRFFPLIFGTINPFIFYFCAKLEMQKNTASWIAIAYLCTIYASLISGVFILPDAPLSFFTLLAVYFSLQFIKKLKWKYLFAFAAFMALGMASKYQMVFVGLALFLYIIKFERQLFNNSKIYAAAFIAGLGLVPTLIWNAQNDWINFTFHTDRIGSANFFEYFFREIFGQFFYQNPIIFILIIYALFLGKKQNLILNSNWKFYNLSLALPLISIAIILSIFTETLPHWSGIAYIGLLLNVGLIIDKSPKFQPFKSIKWAFVFLLFICVFGYLEIENGFIFNPKDKKQSIVDKGRHDPTLDLYGWDQLNIAFSKLQQEYPKASNVIMSQRWYPAAHFDYYIARNNAVQVIVEGSEEESHEYMFKDNEKIFDANRCALFIAPSNYRYRPEHHLFHSFEIVPLDTIPIYRKNEIVKYHFVYLMTRK